jgi:hypothetical protein
MGTRDTPAWVDRKLKENRTLRLIFAESAPTSAWLFAAIYTVGKAHRQECLCYQDHANWRDAQLAHSEMIRGLTIGACLRF